MTKCEQIEIGRSVPIPLHLSNLRAIKPFEDFAPADNLRGDVACIVTVGEPIPGSLSVAFKLRSGPLVLSSPPGVAWIRRDDTQCDPRRNASQPA
jgi:hypothetical protein